MKTKKTLRITCLIQVACCLIMLLDFGSSAYYANTQIPVPEGSVWFHVLDHFGGLAMLLWIAPAAFTCLIVNLLAFLDERKDPEQRRMIGLRWLWIPVSFLGTLAVKWLYLWLIVAVILWPDRFPV